MPGRVHTSAGTTMSVSAAAPATFDAAGYAALAWTPIGEITDPGEFGRKFAVIKHTPVGTRGNKKFKGSFDEGQMNVKMALDNGDAGQQILKTARDNDNDYSFKVTLPGGDAYHFQAKVTEFQIGGMTVDAVTAATVGLELTTTNTGVGVVEVLT
jgi:hypothetical protein